MLTFEPKIPMGLWWAVAAAAVAAVLWYALRREWPIGRDRRIVITVLVALGMVGPLVIALNPIWIEPLPLLPGQPRLTVLLDGTSSMKVTDGDPDAASGSEVTRWQRGVEFASSVVAGESPIEVQKLVFADTAIPLPPRSASTDFAAWPKGQRTDLAGVLTQTIRSGASLGHAILLISDGAHNVGSTSAVLAAASEANSSATPIYTLTTGGQIGLKNLSLMARNPRMIAFPDAPLALRVRVAHSGLAGYSSQVTLFRDNTPMETKTVRLSEQTVQELHFELPEGPDAPLRRYRFVATEVPGEATAADNQTTVLVQRLEAPIGVLALEGKPYWDNKFLIRNLGSDPVVSLTSFTQVGPSRFLRRQLVTPDGANTSGEQTDADAEKTDHWSIQQQLENPLEELRFLDDYRLVILGRDADSYLTPSAVENLRTWIAKSGGCLLCSRGAPSNQIASKLAEILPVRWDSQTQSRFRARLSQYGVDAAVFDSLLETGRDPLASLPSLSSGATPQPRSGLPQVLIQSIDDTSGGSIPVVTYQSYGGGQTIVVEGAGMWRWAFLPPEHADKDKIYPSLWQSMVQWVVSQQDLMPGQQVAIRPDLASFMAGDRVTASLTVKQPELFLDSDGRIELTVLVEPGDGPLPRRVSPAASGMDESIFRVDLGELPVGYYAASVVSGPDDRVLAETAVEVRDPWYESLDVDARPDLMRRIAQLSGGEVVRPSDVTALVERFEQRLRDQRPSKEIRTTLWDRPPVLLAILSGWIGTWIVRRRMGLI